MIELGKAKSVSVILALSAAITILSTVTSDLWRIFGLHLNVGDDYWVIQYIEIAIEVILVLAVIASLYMKNKKTGKIFVAIAFGLFSLQYCYGLLQYADYIWKAVNFSNFYRVYNGSLSVFLMVIGLTTAVITIVDVCLNNRLVFCSKIMYIISGGIALLSHLFNGASRFLNHTMPNVWDLLNLTASVLFWGGLILWANYLRKPNPPVQQNEIDRMVP